MSFLTIALKDLKTIWLKISRNGLLEQEGVFGHREVMFLNKVLGIGFVVLLLMLPIEITMNGFELVPLELTFMGTMVFCFFLQRHRFFWLAKLFAVVVSQVFVVAAGVMVGKGISNHVALIPLSLFGMLLFKPTRDKVLVLLITIFSYFLLLYLREHVAPTFPLSQDIKDFFTHVF